MTGKDGKKKAVNASIEGVSTKRNIYTYAKKSQFKFNLLLFILIVVAFSLVLFTLSPFISEKYNEILKNNNEIFEEEDFTGFSCQGKQRCYEMTSCKEARFYLKYCPNVKIDGDHDGKPCERRCGH